MDITAGAALLQRAHSYPSTLWLRFAGWWGNKAALAKLVAHPAGLTAEQRLRVVKCVVSLPMIDDTFDCQAIEENVFLAEQVLKGRFSHEEKGVVVQAIIDAIGSEKINAFCGEQAAARLARAVFSKKVDSEYQYMVLEICYAKLFDTPAALLRRNPVDYAHPFLTMLFGLPKTEIGILENEWGRLLRRNHSVDASTVYQFCLFEEAGKRALAEVVIDPTENDGLSRLISFEIESGDRSYFFSFERSESADQMTT